MFNVLFLNTPTSINWATSNADGSVTFNFTPISFEANEPVQISTQASSAPVAMPLNMPLITPIRINVSELQGAQTTAAVTPVAQPAAVKGTLQDVLQPAKPQTNMLSIDAMTSADREAKYRAYRVEGKPEEYAHVPDDLWEAFMASDNMEYVARKYLTLFDLPKWDSQVFYGEPPSLKAVEPTEERMHAYDYLGVISQMIEKAESTTEWYDRLMTKSETLSLLYSLYENLAPLTSAETGDAKEGYALATRYFGNGSMNTQLPELMQDRVLMYVRKLLQEQTDLVLQSFGIPNSYSGTILSRLENSTEFVSIKESFISYLSYTESSTKVAWKPSGTLDTTMSAEWFGSYLDKELRSEALAGNYGRITSSRPALNNEQQQSPLKELLGQESSVKETTVPQEAEEVIEPIDPDYIPKALNFPMEFPMPKPAIYSHVPDELYEAFANTNNINKFDERAFEGLYGLFELPKWQVRTVHDQEPILERKNVTDADMMQYDYNKVIDLRIQMLERNGTYRKEVGILRSLERNITKVQQDYELSLGGTTAPEAHNAAQRLVKNRHEQALYDTYNLSKSRLNA